ncbi:MAG TPA: AAA family ATPase, partial [Myxococcota bacterium]|nr:AAA family ATPase [Myxococcota bacterium]
MRLGPAELDAERCELRLEARRVRMEPRVFAVLAHLVRHAGRVVGREELIDAIWGSADVSDWAVARAVKEVRRVLARSGCGASIETVRGRGFALRLPAPVFPRGPPFVGRADVVAQLDEALVAAALGAGQIVLLEGEAGIGKTRTWLEFAPRARQRGARIAASRCDPLAATNPFWPWAQLLRAAAREEEAFAASLPDPDRSLLAQVFPGIAPPAAPAAPCDPGTPDQARLRLFEAVLCALGARGCDAPRVLWIDDLQWADADSLRLLAYVARGVATLPILLIAALRRPDGATAGEGGEAAGSILRAGARALRLRGLGRGEVEALWRALRADVPDAATLDRLLARTRGNPFFLVHLLRQDDPEHALAGRDGVRTAARDLLGGLSSEGTELLAMAAVAGEECDVNVLAGALERP